MKKRRILLLVCCFQILCACKPLYDNFQTENKKDNHGLDVNATHPSVNKALNVAAKNPRDEFKSKFPTPENINTVKSLWMDAEADFKLAMTKGFSAKVYINDNKNNVTYGSDVYINEKDIVHIREYRGQSQSFIYNQKVCINRIDHIDSLDDIENYTTEYLPSAENNFDWVCSVDEDGVYSGIFEFDFDNAFSSSIESISLYGEKLRYIKLLIADDYIANPYVFNREFTLVLGENDFQARSLKIKYNNGVNNVEYAQWDYDYSVPVKFIDLPKDRIKNE